jgi:cell division protein FtsI/penicillin-binding protein 2
MAMRSASSLPEIDGRIHALLFVFLIVCAVVIVRLGLLMLVQHEYYTNLAAGTHQTYQTLLPDRGEIFLQDTRDQDEFPLAINRDYFLMFADTRLIEGSEEADRIARILAEELGYDDEKKLALFYQLNKGDDPYEPIEQKLDQEIKERIDARDLPGIAFVRKPFRYYPEETLAAQVVGFLGKDEEGNDRGRYGVEGYWDSVLSGSGGFFEGVKSAGGGIISLAGLTSQEPEDGADILLTLDRSLQHRACQILQKRMEEYEAESASLVVLDPKSGAIRVMCNVPSFDPNIYNKVETIQVYNNNTIFTPYEPGSIFKPIAVAGALDQELITPETPFYDTGVSTDFCDTPIKNAGSKVYKDTTMTGILENSINTGMVAIAEMLGKKTFREYIESFGFGKKEGIALDREVTGTVESLYRNKGNRMDCYTATASFGQGLTATPIQLATAYMTIANGGTFLRPYIVDEVRYSDGRVDRTKPTEVRQVISPRAATLLSGMLVSVVDSGHAGGAAVPGYYIGGKTGTAQIPGPGGYTAETIHSFVGFGPIDDPAFVMLVKFEKPKRQYSSSTAAPTFGEIADLILTYYRIPPSR